MSVRGIITGGVADKLGNDYERMWVIWHVVRMLGGEADEITIEVLGENGAEFSITRGTVVEWHQAKGSNAGKPYSPNLVGSVLSSLKHRYNENSLVHFVTAEDTGKMRVLCQNVKLSPSVHEFSEHAGQEVSRSFQSFKVGIGSDNDAEIFYWLNRTRVESVSELWLTEQVQILLRLMFLCEPRKALLEIGDLVSKHLRRPLTSEQIRALLDAKGVYRVPSVDADTFAALCEESFQFYAHSQPFQVAGYDINRAESEQILVHLRASEQASICFLTGDAGSGKSCILRAVVTALKNEGWLALAIRLDRQNQLYNLLPQAENFKNISLVQYLAQVSKVTKVVVVIDQLDALSSVSGRHSEQFDEILPTIQQIVSLPNVHLVIGCRGYDLDFDYRIRKLKSEFTSKSPGRTHEVVCAELGDEAISSVLSHLGVEIGSLTASTRRLLANPARLSMFAELIASYADGDRDFNSPHALLEQFWEYKRSEFAKRFAPEKWDKGISLVLDELNARQRLAVPRRFLESGRDSVDALISAGILIADKSGYVAFCHETMFDYAFARRLCGGSSTICDWLLATDQQLFRRGQLRQALTYLRTADLGGYRSELTQLLAHPNIRAHLKSTVFQSMSLLIDPQVEDWQIIQDYWMNGDHPLFHISSSATWRSAAWANLFEQEGLFEEILSGGNQKAIDKAAAFLQSQVDVHPALVAKYILWVFENKPDMDNVAQWLLNRCLWTGHHQEVRRAFEIAIERGYYDHEQSQQLDGFWNIIDQKDGYSSDAAAHLIGLFLESAFARGTILNQLRTYFPNASKPILAIAESSPEEFLDAAFAPLMATYGQEQSAATYDLPYSVWSGAAQPDISQIDSALLFGLAASLGSFFLKDDQAANSAYVRKLLEIDNELTWAVILIGAEQYPAPAIAALVMQLFIQCYERADGYGSFYSLREYWAKVFQAIQPHLSTKMLHSLEGAILQIVPEREKERLKEDGHISLGQTTMFGWTQYSLLYGLNSDRSSVAAKRRLREWERKFLEPPDLGRGHVHGGEVGSPLPEIAHQKMSNRQWIAAMGKQWPRWSGRVVDGHLAGDSGQLAWSGLKSRAKAEPERFARLLLDEFDSAIAPDFWKAAIQGLNEAENLDLLLFEKVLQKSHQSGIQSLQYELARAIQSKIRAGLSAETISILSDLAINSPDPSEETWKVDTSAGRKHGGSPEAQGTNCVRGVASRALEQYLYEYPTKFDDISEAVDAVANDQSVAVRSVSMSMYPYLHHHQMRDGFALFMQTTMGMPELRSGNGPDHCFRYFLHHRWSDLQPLLEALLNSNESELVERAGVYIGIAWLRELVSEGDFAAYTEGSISLRKGLARVAAANFDHQEFEGKCCALLRRFLFDEVAEVRAVADDFLQRMKSIDVERFEHLINIYLDSPAFVGGERVFRLIKDAPAASPQLVLRAADALLKLNGDDLSNMKTAIPLSAQTGCQLLLAAYNNTPDVDLRRICLDRFDQLTLKGAYGLETALQQYDRI